MKGKLHKTEKGWVLINNFIDPYGQEPYSLPLHPDYVKHYFLAEGGDVECDIVILKEDSGEVFYYAKLKH